MVLEFFRGILGLTSSFIQIPVVKADSDDDDEDELVDPIDGIRAACRKKPEAQPLIQKYEECNIRVRSKKSTRETCEEELHDLIKFIDHCCAHELFDYLK